MFSVNTQGRIFLEQKFILIRNGFINNGLFTFDLGIGFNAYQQLEKLCLEASTRNIENRVLRINFNTRDINLTIFNEIIKKIKAKDQHLKLHFKLLVN